MTFNGASAVFALFASYFWLKSAKVKLSLTFPIEIYSEHIADESVIGQSIVSSGSNSQIDDLGKAMICQSKLSARAAFCAAGAAICQVFALFFS
jgi:hypothetical protein